MPVYYLRQRSYKTSITCSDTGSYLQSRRQRNLQKQSRKIIWVVVLLLRRKPLPLRVQLALTQVESQLTDLHLMLLQIWALTFQAWDHVLVSFTPAAHSIAPNIIRDCGSFLTSTHFLPNSPPPIFLKSPNLSPAQPLLSFPWLNSPLYNLLLRISNILQSFILLLTLFIHWLLTRNWKESSLQLQPI